MHPEKWSAKFIEVSYGFDAVGVVKENGESIIILCLESRPDNNLDEYISGNEELENWCFSGFKKYFSPKVDRFLIDFEKSDSSACPLPAHSDSVQLKSMAIKAGIGVQGRNTLIINNKFDCRLRFIAIKTSLGLTPTGPGIYEKIYNDRCDQCRLCELVCPTGVLKDYKLLDRKKCIAYWQLTDKKPNLVRCGLCWQACTRSMKWAKQKKSQRSKILNEMSPQYAYMFNR